MNILAVQDGGASNRFFKHLIKILVNIIISTFFCVEVLIILEIFKSSSGAHVVHLLTDFLVKTQKAWSLRHLMQLKCSRISVNKNKNLQQENKRIKVLLKHGFHSHFCKLQKYPSTGVLIKRFSENIQQIYHRTLMPKSDCN